MTAFVPATMLADDWREGLFLGRIETAEGPTPVLLKGGILYDMSRVAPTAAQLVADRAFDVSKGKELGDLESLDLSSDGTPRLLSPVDLQCVKAAGVTFAVSAVERVIEERARGDCRARPPECATGSKARIGGGIRSVVARARRKRRRSRQALIDDGMWSQYLEVAIGPDAEIFTKSPVLSTRRLGRRDRRALGFELEQSRARNRARRRQPWRAASARALGNDVNLRDFEGR